MRTGLTRLRVGCLWTSSSRPPGGPGRTKQQPGPGQREDRVRRHPPWPGLGRQAWGPSRWVNGRGSFKPKEGDGRGSRGSLRAAPCCPRALSGASHGQRKPLPQSGHPEAQTVLPVRRGPDGPSDLAWVCSFRGQAASLLEIPTQRQGQASPSDLVPSPRVEAAGRAQSPSPHPQRVPPSPGPVGAAVATRTRAASAEPCPTTGRDTGLLPALETFLIGTHSKTPRLPPQWLFFSVASLECHYFKYVYRWHVFSDFPSRDC